MKNLMILQSYRKLSRKTEFILASIFQRWFGSWTPGRELMETENNSNPVHKSLSIINYSSSINRCLIENI